MSFLPDPITDVIGLFFKKALDSKIMQFATLLLEMAIAGSIGYLVARGVAIMAGQPALIADGTADLAAGICLFATFQASPNSKGLTISVQSRVAAEKLDTPTTTITRK